MVDLTKAAAGLQFGDVSNSAIRNILTYTSIRLYGKFTRQDMEDTLDYFDWKCPYTGRDLRNLIVNHLGGYATDHIVPQNKDYCGLNIKGNLVFVDKDANSKKGRRSVEDFLLDETLPFWENTPLSIRHERLEKIREFQRECGYDPEKIMKKVHPLLERMYREVQKEQERKIEEVIKATGLKPLTPIKPSRTSAVNVSQKGNRRVPTLVFNPSNENEFKSQLIRTKKASITLKYDTGRVSVINWNANNFNEESNLRTNIQSKTFWRSWKTDGLVGVEVNIQ